MVVDANVLLLRSNQSKCQVVLQKEYLFKGYIWSTLRTSFQCRTINQVNDVWAFMRRQKKNSGRRDRWIVGSLRGVLSMKSSLINCIR